jgi:hypothetical protein
MIDKTLTSIQELVKHQNTLLVVHKTLQSLQEQMKEAETVMELAQR